MKKQDQRSVSTVSIYGSSKQLCLAAPVSDLTIAGKKYTASFVQLDFREIVDLLAFDDDGRTYFGLYNKNGENLSGTELGPYISAHNLFDNPDVDLNVICKQMGRSPDWMQGILLRADGYETSFYKKD